jgi:uncharacterized small protein (DUF1192 family)
MTRRPTGKRRGRPAIAKPTVLPVEAPADAKPFLPIEPEPPPAKGWQQSPWQPLAPTGGPVRDLQAEVAALRSEVASLRLHVVPEGVNQLARTIDALDTGFVALRDGIAQQRSETIRASEGATNAMAILHRAVTGMHQELSQLGTHTDPVAAGMIGDIHRIMQEWSRTLFPHLANETNKRITSLQAEIEQLRLALDKKAKRKAKKAARDDAKAKRRVADLFGPSVRTAEARVSELDKARRRDAKRNSG